jgi:hypothetical protein
LPSISAACAVRSNAGIADTLGAVTIAALALRTYVRYLVPLTLLAAVVFAPVIYGALRMPAPRDPVRARAALTTAWVIASTAWMFQLALVGAAAPLARAVAAGAAPGQLRAFGRAAVQLARTLVPCLAAIAAVAIGGLALMVPGLMLLVLLALTGASTRCGLPAPLLDSIDLVRASARAVIAVVAAMLVVDLAIAFAAQQLLVPPLTRKMKPVQLVPYRDLVRVTAVAVMIVSPIVATALAAIAARATSRRS